MEDDFEFYGEDTTEQGEKEIAGITGKVTGFTYTGVSFPCIVFKDSFSCPKHQLNVISNMVKSQLATKDISLYFANKGETYKIGMIDGIQLEAFLEIVGEDNVTAYLSEEEKLEGSMIYSLCTIGY